MTEEKHSKCPKCGSSRIHPIRRDVWTILGVVIGALSLWLLQWSGFAFIGLALAAYVLLAAAFYPPTKQCYACDHMWQVPRKKKEGNANHKRGSRPKRKRHRSK